MNFGGLIFLLIAHFLCGRGLLRLLKVELRPLHLFCFSMMLGVPVLSFAPCFLQLMNVPIAANPVAVVVLVMTVLFCIPLALRFRTPDLGKITLPALHELPFIAVITCLVLLSVWRCYYYPPYARDMLSGPELLAEYAVRENTMISSVFTIDLQSSNNYFKSPYITGLQIVYKELVCPFGQLWLSVLSVPFVIWLYSLLKERLHSLVAGFLLMFFVCIPELYAYSYMMLYDYSNMVFFFAGFYFLSRYFKDSRQRDFLFSAMLFGFATYIRTETLLLMMMVLPLAVFNGWRQKKNIKGLALQVLLLAGIPAAFYVVCIHVFVRLFVPIPFDVSGQINPNLGDLSLFVDRLKGVQTRLIFSERGVGLFGYFVFFFYGLLAADLFVSRRYGQESRTMLYGIVVVMVGLPVLGYLLPVVDLDNTTKRGLFKMLPLMLLYMGNSPLLQRLSVWLSSERLKPPLTLDDAVANSMVTGPGPESSGLPGKPPKAALK